MFTCYFSAISLIVPLMLPSWFPVLVLKLPIVSSIEGVFDWEIRISISHCSTKISVPLRPSGFPLLLLAFGFAFSFRFLRFVSALCQSIACPRYFCHSSLIAPEVGQLALTSHFPASSSPITVDIDQLLPPRRLRRVPCWIQPSKQNLLALRSLRPRIFGH